MGKPILPPHNTITEGDTIGVRLSNRPERVWLLTEDCQRLITMLGHRAWSWADLAH